MCCFFFNDTATTEIYTLSLHDALPISADPHEAAVGSFGHARLHGDRGTEIRAPVGAGEGWNERRERSEEHTSELQSRQYLVCRLLLEKKKTRETGKRDEALTILAEIYH